MEDRKNRAGRAPAETSQYDDGPMLGTLRLVDDSEQTSATLSIAMLAIWVDMSTARDQGAPHWQHDPN